MASSHKTAPVILNPQELPSGRQTEANISFDLRFEVAGERTIEVGLDRKENAGKSLRLPVDERPQDNVRYLVAPIRDRLKILLVDGKPAKTRFENGPTSCVWPSIPAMSKTSTRST